MSDLSKENPTGPEPDNQKPLRILAAEDEIVVATLMEAHFGRRGHSIVIVPSADQALEELQRARDEGSDFDVLITDRGLEGPKDGFQLVAEMNEKGLGNNTCAIMLSGSAEDIRKENPGNQLAKKGIQGLFGKPFLSVNVDQMVVVVKEFREQRNLQ